MFPCRSAGTCARNRPGAHARRANLDDALERGRNTARMSETATVDVIAAVEKSQPQIGELEQARDAADRDAEIRKKLQNLIASLPADLSAAEGDKTLALKRGLALWVAGRETEAAHWLK